VDSVCAETGREGRHQTGNEVMCVHGRAEIKEVQVCGERAAKRCAVAEVLQCGVRVMVRQ